MSGSRGPATGLDPLGDLNLPRGETTDGEVITFAEDHPECMERWDAAERSILRDWPSGISTMSSAPSTASSAKTRAGCCTRAHGARPGFESTRTRFGGLRPVWCDYHHGWREQGLTDHSGMEAIFER